MMVTAKKPAMECRYDMDPYGPFEDSKESEAVFTDAGKMLDFVKSKLPKK